MFKEFSTDRHEYYLNGEHFPSVTTILKDAGLVGSFGHNDQAAWRGTSVHTLTAIDDEGRLDFRTVPKELRGYVKGWRKFRFDTGFTPELIEHRVDCLACRYSGQLDRTGYILGQKFPIILDIKTGNPPPYTKLQLSGYAYALDPRQVYLRYAVGLKADGGYQVQRYPLEDFGLDRATWLEIVNKQKEKI